MENQLQFGVSPFFSYSCPKTVLSCINGTAYWFIKAANLKTGEVYRGSPKDGIKVDTTITIDDADMVEMVGILIYERYRIEVKQHVEARSVYSFPITNSN